MTLLTENKLAAASIVAVIAGLIAFYAAFYGTVPESADTAPVIEVPATVAPADSSAAPAAPEAPAAPAAPEAPAAPGETTVVPVPPTNEPVSH